MSGYGFRSLTVPRFTIRNVHASSAVEQRYGIAIHPIHPHREDKKMPIINLKVLSGASSTTLESFDVNGPYDPFTYIGNKNPQGTNPGYQVYQAVFANIDGAIAIGAPAASPTAGYASYYYRAVNLCAQGGGGGGTECFVIGFDATADTTAPVTFAAEHSSGLVVKGGTPLASGAAIDTSTVGWIVTAPATDGIAQSAGYEPAAFSDWVSLTTGLIVSTGVGLKPSAFSGPLTLAVGADDVFLAVYVAPPKPATTGPQPPPITLGSNCPQLLANYADAQNAVTAAEANPKSSQGLIQSLKQIEAAAEQAAAPCRAAALSGNKSL
jgi:hypothetical protein